MGEIMADTTTEQRAKSKKVGALRGLWPFLRPYRPMMITAGLALVLTASVSLILPLAVRRVIALDQAPRDHDPDRDRAQHQQTEQHACRDADRAAL